MLYFGLIRTVDRLTSKTNPKSNVSKLAHRVVVVVVADVAFVAVVAAAVEPVEPLSLQSAPPSPSVRIEVRQGC